MNQDLLISEWGTRLHTGLYRTGFETIEQATENSDSWLLGHFVGDAKHIVLDAGCGFGDLSRDAALEGHTVFALDAVDQEIEEEEGRKINFVKGDMMSLPDEITGIDYVLAQESLSFVADPLKAARELRRVCNGRLIFSGMWTSEEDPARMELYYEGKLYSV